MGIFSRTPTVAVQGILERIGILHAGESTVLYTFLLEGDPQRYVTNDYVGGRATNIELAMVKPGDSVRFGVREGTGDVRGFFENHTMAARTKR